MALGRLRFCSLRLNRISCESIRHQLPRHYSTQPYSIHTIRFPGLSRWKIKGLLLMLMQSNVIQPPTKEGGEGVALATTVYVHTPLPPQHRRTRSKVTVDARRVHTCSPPTDNAPPGLARPYTASHVCLDPSASRSVSILEYHAPPSSCEPVTTACTCLCLCPAGTVMHPLRTHCVYAVVCHSRRYG